MQVVNDFEPPFQFSLWQGSCEAACSGFEGIPHRFWKDSVDMDIAFLSHYYVFIHEAPKNITMGTTSANSD